MADYIVKDSSVWKDNHSNKLLDGGDYSIRIGIVREHVFLENSEETRYIVEVWKNNRVYPMTCIRTSRFGGVYNYEEYNHRGFNPGKDNVSLGNYSVVPGDMVIVAASNGQSREGIILGSMNHVGRDEILTSTGDVAYISEFNGISTAINKFGEYKQTFKGLPTNLDKLLEAPTGAPIPPAEYDTEVGGSFVSFDSTGSYIITDSATSDPQSILINKPDGQIVIISGSTSLVIDKATESYTITNKVTTFDSADEWNLNTTTMNIESTDVNITATNITTKGEWAQTGNMAITGNVDQIGNNDIRGDLTHVGGTASLAGGANALIYDIILTIGVGNLGLPVLSNNIVLKTILTKAT